MVLTFSAEGTRRVMCKVASEHAGGDVIPHTLVGLHDGCTRQIARASGLRTLQIAGAGAAINALASH